jgi:hypothetical protein
MALPIGRTRTLIDRLRTVLPANLPTLRYQSQPRPRHAIGRSTFEAINAASSQEVISFGAMMATRPATERAEWEAPLSRGEVNRCGLGVIDERAKAFSPTELIGRDAELHMLGAARVSEFLITRSRGSCGIR